MRNLIVSIAVVALVVSVVSPAWAQGAANQTPANQTPAAPAEPQYPKISIGTLTYLQYGAELQNRDDYNAFDITRGYINITGDLARNIKFRLTPDLRRITDGSLAGSLAFRLKYGFIEFDELLPRSWVRFGLHQTPWLDFEESINRYRVQGQMFAEREGVIPGSGDFGVGLLMRGPNDYGEINVGVYNGEGFTRAEVDKRKSIQARITIRPMPKAAVAKGFRVSAFVDAGLAGENRPKRHAILMGSYEHPHFVGTAEWLAGESRTNPVLASTEFRGYSIFAEVRQGMEGWAGLARFESFDPDRRFADNSHQRAIAGIAYWMKWSAVKLGMVVNDENVSYDVGAGRPRENRLLFQTHVQF
jgi:hypothetical protein